MGYKAVELGKVGIVAPIANSSVIFTILFSIIFFKESLSVTQVISITFIIIGIILISIDFANIRNSSLFNIASGVPLALVTCFLWGVVFFLFKIPVNAIGPILTSFIVEFGIMIFSGLHLKISKVNVSMPDKRMIIYLFIVAFFGAVALLFFNIGITVADVSIVSAITFANPLVACLYGRVVYKEKFNLQQYGAILLILVGIILISHF